MFLVQHIINSDLSRGMQITNCNLMLINILFSTSLRATAKIIGNDIHKNFLIDSFRTLRAFFLPDRTSIVYGDSKLVVLQPSVVCYALIINYPSGQ